MITPWIPFAAAALPTPAFVLDLDALRRTAQRLSALRGRGIEVLYSAKASPLSTVLQTLAPWVDGYSAASRFEAQLVHECVPGYPVSLATPGLVEPDFATLAVVCSRLTLNSLEQLQRYAADGGPTLGLRVNPQWSGLGDPRFDPCRPHSKLGVPLSLLLEICAGAPAALQGIAGLHVHNQFEARDASGIRATAARLEPLLTAWPGKLTWVNFGGGVLAESPGVIAELRAVAAALRQRHKVTVIFEPGKAYVGRAGFLVTSVIDRFIRDGKNLLILDTTVNHLPEVFEYQKAPLLLNATPTGRNVALVYGCTCLSGDWFGEYQFDRLPELGDRLVFGNVGAYTMIKAHRFNGVNLPAIWTAAHGACRLVKRYDYEDYARQWRAEDGFANI